MEEKVPTIICTYELHNGYIFKNYFAFNSLRGRPVVTVLNNKIVSNNITADNELYASSSLYGDEINLNWNPEIPVNDRQISLTYNAANMQQNSGRIKKKDQAKIFIAQVRNSNDPYNFSGPNSSDEFIIYISCGNGGDGREGLKSVAATRTTPTITVIKYPELISSSLLIIPISHFKQMIDSFTKCKKDSIRLCYYNNNDVVDGREVKGAPGVVITNDGGIIEKYGVVPDADCRESSKSLTLPNFQLPNLAIDESSIVRPGGAPHIILEVEKATATNEFIFRADKIAIFSKQASMHNEGNVRIEYQEGCHLKIVHRFGAFGECELCLHNKYVKY